MREDIRRSLHDDSGVVLITVVGVLLLVTIVALAAWTMSNENHNLSLHDKRSNAALHTAEAGLDAAMWKLRVLGANTPHLFTVTTRNGTASVTTSQTSEFTYKIVAVGSVDASPAPVQRTVSTEVFSMSLWNLILASGAASPVGSGGGHFNGSGYLTGPFYMRGNLDFSNGNSAFYGGPLFVKKGDIILAGSSEIGRLGQEVQVYCDQNYPVGNANFHPLGAVNPNVPDISLPKVSDHMSEYRLDAESESTDGRIGTRGSGGVNDENRTVNPPNPPGRSASAYKVIDTDTSTNGSSGGLVLSTATSFGSATDDFACVGGILYVRGTVFVDGPITINGPIHYSGNGTLVANGDIDVYGDLLPNDLFPSIDALGLTTTGSVKLHNNSTQVKAAVYAANSLDMVDNNQYLEGAVLTNTFGLPHGGQIVTQPQLPAYLPPSLPGGDGNVVFPSAWHDGPR